MYTMGRAGPVRRLFLYIEYSIFKCLWLFIVVVDVYDTIRYDRRV